MARSKVLYRVHLDSPRHVEEIKRSGECAALLRYGRVIANFAITPGQVKKLKKRKGTIQITDRQKTAFHARCSRPRYGY